jgi:hypothetical protein
MEKRKYAPSPTWSPTRSGQAGKRRSKKNITQRREKTRRRETGRRKLEIRKVKLENGEEKLEGRN